MRMIVGLAMLLATNAALASDPLSGSFQDCVSEASRSGAPLLKKTELNGGAGSLLSIQCSSGPAAAQLFEAVGRFSREEGYTTASGALVVTRFFGREGELMIWTSHCTRRIRNPDGSEANAYWCNLDVNVSGEMLRALNLK